MEDQEAMVTKEKQQTTKMAILWTTFSEMGIARCSVLKRLQDIVSYFLINSCRIVFPVL